MPERPAPFQLYQQALDETKGQPTSKLTERYLELMREHGHLVPRQPGDDSPLFACGYDPRPERRRRIEVDHAELIALVEENQELRAMLGRAGKDSGRMWYDRAQRLKRERDNALAEVARLRDLVGDG
jgi:hypothetical protein